MISMREAVTAAKEQLHTIFDQDEIYDVRLEEIWSSEDDDFWLVTLSFLEREKRDRVDVDVDGTYSEMNEAKEGAPGIDDPVLMGFLAPFDRVLKVLKIRKSDGEFAGMTIRAA